MEGDALAKARRIIRQVKPCSALSVRKELAQESNEVEVRVVVHNGFGYPSEDKTRLAPATAQLPIFRGAERLVETSYPAQRLSWESEIV
jgi:hypothetical protein